MVHRQHIHDDSWVTFHRITSHSAAIFVCHLYNKTNYATKTRAQFSIRSATNTLFQIRKATCKYFTVIWTIWNRVVNFYRIQIHRDICILFDSFCTANVHRKKNGMKTVIFIANLRILQPTSNISYMSKSYIDMHWFYLLQIPATLVFALFFKRRLNTFHSRYVSNDIQLVFLSISSWNQEKEIVFLYNLNIVFFWYPQDFPPPRG